MKAVPSQGVASDVFAQRHAKELVAALSLAEQCIHLAPDGSMRSYAKTAGFLRSSGESPEFRDRRVLALYEVSTPQDVHYPTWEMHPQGDELLIALSGSLAVEFREAGAGRKAMLPPRSAIVVPAGVWHRLIVNERSLLIAITPRQGTAHGNT